MLRKILIEPDPILRKKCEPLEKVDKDTQKLMNDMLETMYFANGIGLAAIQVGIAKRIIVMDLSKENEKKEPMYFVNPVIKNKNKELSTYEEGCLSVPGQFAEINRPNECDVEYLDYQGEKKLLHATGLLATCIQHEIDHCDGKLFIDYLSKLKKNIIIKKLSKQKNNPARIVV